MNDRGNERNRNQQRKNIIIREDVGNGSKQLPVHGTQKGKGGEEGKERGSH